MTQVLKLCLVLLAALPGFASAAEVVGTYTPLGGSQWSLAFTVTNTATPVPVHQFTVYFDESLFAGLAVTGTPATWDSLVIQPDTGLPAAGFFDGLVLDAADALGLGESAAGFSMTFEYLGSGTPGALPFDFLDANMKVIASGRTLVTTGGGTPVPEPASWLLVAAAAMAMAGLVRRRQTAQPT